MNDPIARHMQIETEWGEVVNVCYFIETDVLKPENVRKTEITITGVEPEGILTTAEIEREIKRELSGA